MLLPRLTQNAMASVGAHQTLIANRIGLERGFTFSGLSKIAGTSRIFVSWLNAMICSHGSVPRKNVEGTECGVGVPVVCPFLEGVLNRSEA
jgi:hypothetical protein